MTKLMDNQTIADHLEQVADLLEMDDGNPFRIRAYRQGAEAVRGADREVARMVQEGRENELEKVPGIGSSLAGAIAELVHTGRLSLLERLQRVTGAGGRFRQVPGIGPELARRIEDELDAQSLEELEVAAHDGRLAAVPGFGSRRLKGVRQALDSMLRREGRSGSHRKDRAEDGHSPEPSVASLLDIDRQYREKAEAGRLRKIAPRRFNPEREAWLPIMKGHRDGYQYTALFSNTAKAHERGKTHDWVVIYLEREGGKGQEKRYTVVTETRGDMQGRRVVRGRENESRDYYADIPNHASAERTSWKDLT